MGQRAHPALRVLARALYAPVSKSRRLTRWFLVATGALLRATGPFPLKSNLINSLSSFAWPQVELPRRSVRVCGDVAIDLVPHVGEFDFRALLAPDLGYELELFDALRPRVREFDAIVEIGANVGVFTAFFAKTRANDSVPIFAFEPSREAYRRLLANLRGPNVQAIPAAVADTCGLLPFHEPEGHLTNGSLLPAFAGHFSSRVATSVVPSVDGQAVSDLVGRYARILLKVDVEGAESRVITALEHLIAGKRPTLVLEVLREFEEELNSLAVLKAHYEFHQVTRQGLQRRDALVASDEGRDFLLLPR